MTKLTGTQLIVLSSASKHDEGLATRPINLHAAAQKVATSLINKGLVREIRAKTHAPVWHENDDGRFALNITKAGREAIGVDDEEAEDAGSCASPHASKSKKSARKSAGAKSASTAAVLLMTDVCPSDAKVALLQKMIGTSVRVTGSGGPFYEISSVETSKGEALLRLVKETRTLSKRHRSWARFLGMTQHDVMAIGDNLNDVEMLGPTPHSGL